MCVWCGRRVSCEYSEFAGAAMSFFLSVGLGAGALVSVILVKYVVWRLSSSFNTIDNDTAIQWHIHGNHWQVATECVRGVP